MLANRTKCNEGIPLPSESHSKALNVAASLVSFTLVVGILYFAKVVLVPVALAIMLAFVLNPFVTRLNGWGLGRVPAVIATILLAATLLAALFTTVSFQLDHLANDLPRYQSNIQRKISLLRERSKGGALDKIRQVAEQVARDGPPVKSGDVPSPKAAVREPIEARIVTEEGLLSRALGPLRSLAPALEPMATGFLALILTIFMLIKREDLRNRLVSFASKGSLTTTTKALDEAGGRISRYMTMQLIINGSFGLAVGLGLFFIGVPYAALWGLCAAVLRYIPYVGAWMAAAAPLAISFVTLTGWWPMLAVLGLFLVLELVTGNVLEPMLYGQGTGVSEVALLVCATFWAWIWGPVGLILATPLTVCLVVTGKYVPPLSFFDRLLGDRPALEPFIAYLQRLLARDAVEAAAVARSYCDRAPVETVYDAVFVPALRLARQDRASGGMTADDESFVLRRTEEITGEIQALQRSTGGTAAANPAATSSLMTIYGFPAHHEADELTLRMLDGLVSPLGLRVRTFSTRSLPSEMIEEVRDGMPLLVFIAALPPGGLPQASYLCETLRENWPDLRIIVGYWGSETNLDEIILNLRSAGANYVTTTLLGARDHISSMRPPEVAARPAQRDSLQGRTS